MVKIVSWDQHSKMVTYNNTNPQFFGDFLRPKNTKKLLADTIFLRQTNFKLPGFIQLKESEMQTAPPRNWQRDEFAREKNCPQKKLEAKDPSPWLAPFLFSGFFALKKFGGVIAQAFNGCFWFP